MDTKVMNAKAEYNFEEDMARDIRFNVIVYIYLQLLTMEFL